MVTTTWTQTAGMTGDTDTDNIENYAEQAEASKDAAAASEAAAAASATAAAASETDAESAEVNASASETAAAASATSASSSATAASNSASSASTSATAAASSASAASASETAAGASETAAATSESNASTSEANAATSASNASTSETNAATSATNASTSETNAAASETAAAASETAAQTAQAAAEAAEAATEALFDQFGDQYLGPKASDPTVDNDGNPLAEGAVYFNTTDDVLKFYSGSAWVAPESVATTAAAAAQAAQAASETAEANAETAEANAAASASSASSSASAAATSASEAAASAASINLSSIDIDGGTIDGTVIGGSVPAAGNFTTGSFTGNVAHGDGVKATFGASADLQVYHDGNNSYISDQGQGVLYIQGSNNVQIESATGENMAVFLANNAAELYYDNSKRLATTATGIDVTGTVVADGLTVQGTNVQTLIYEQDGTYNPRLATYFDVSGTHIQHTFSTTASTMFFENGGAVGSGVKRMSIGSNGDISFYEPTGTTPKFFWGASTERLGIGTASPETSLHIVSSQPSISLGDGTFPNDRFINIDAKIAGDDAHGITVDNADSIVFGHKTNNHDTSMSSEAMRIDSSGNLLVGTTSIATAQIPTSTGVSIRGPIGRIEASADGTTSAIFNRDTSDGGIINFAKDGTTVGSIGTTSGGLYVDFGNWTVTESGGSLYFATGGTNKMKLDASGNLDVVGSVNSNATIS